MFRAKASPANPDSVKDITNAAIRLLARREHTFAELQVKLLDRGYQEPAVLQVLEDLANRGVQSDERFTESYVRWRLMCGFGPLKIKQELKDRGVKSPLIAQYTQLSKQEWMDNLNKLRQKRFGMIVPKNDEERAKQARFLQSRGFDCSDIQCVFNE